MTHAKYVLCPRVAIPAINTRHHPTPPHKLTHTDGETWRDPPGYFDTIVWPAYVLAHSKLEQQGVETVDVGNGPEGLTRGFEVVCEMILERVGSVKGTLS